MEHGGINRKTPWTQEAIVCGVPNPAIRVHFDGSNNKTRDSFPY